MVISALIGKLNSADLSQSPVATDGHHYHRLKVAPHVLNALTSSWSIFKANGAALNQESSNRVLPLNNKLKTCRKIIESIATTKASMQALEAQELPQEHLIKRRSLAAVEGKKIRSG